MRRSAAVKIVLRLGRVACKAGPVTRPIVVCGHAVCVRRAGKGRPTALASCRRSEWTWSSRWLDHPLVPSVPAGVTVGLVHRDQASAVLADEDMHAVWALVPVAKGRP